MMMVLLNFNSFLYIIAIILIVCLLVLFRFLPPKNLFSIVVEQLYIKNIIVPHFVYNWIIGGKRDYSTVPDIMTTSDGTKINTISQYETRKKELMQLFEDNVYGPIPRIGYNVDFTVIEEGYNQEYNAIRKQIRITVTSDAGSNEALMLLYIPVSGKPSDVIIGLNFLGNHTVANDCEIIPSYANYSSDSIDKERGIRYSRWPILQIINSGYAIATMYCGDWAEDNKKTYQNRVISLFADNSMRAVTAWAFGIICGVDYLSKDENISSKIACIGHSRLGKTSLWAGANDERISLIIANGSGNTGAALSRYNRGENVRYINYAFPHWFVDKYKYYSKRVNKLPIDQHMLLALIAPRQLYLGEANYDLWADPTGSFNSLQFSSESYRLYGLNTIPNTKPQTDKPIYSKSIAYHLRQGAHNITPIDWKYYIDYMHEYWATDIIN